MLEFQQIPGRNYKKRVFITKSAKKRFLLTNSGVITSTLGVSGLELHSSGTEPLTLGTILAWGVQFSFRGAQPRNASHGVAPAASLQ